MFKDINKEINKLKETKYKERMDKVFKDFEKTIIENEMTLGEVIAVCNGLIKFYQNKASNEYKIT